jgi:hypothetical protein
MTSALAWPRRHTRVTEALEAAQLRSQLDRAQARIARLTVALRVLANALHAGPEHASAKPWRACPNPTCRRIQRLLARQEGA